MFKGRYIDGSILHEVPGQEGNQEAEEDHHEERETSDKRCLFQVWNEGIQNREELELTFH